MADDAALRKRCEAHMLNITRNEYSDVPDLDVLMAFVKTERASAVQEVHKDR